jgi:hypothetical protein
MKKELSNGGKDEENEDKVLQFMSLASVDHDIAVVYLEESQYNLDAAVNRFFSQSPAKSTGKAPKSVSLDEDGYVPLESVPQPKVCIPE